ncbi:hypothetical protein D910_11066 [Dendroctonus ponderosae]|uniref:Uncharacterized protein n=1 Tax=Dendroctonus ponderosae TaxID=77166 RepID=U4UUE6_DENPD|nr:hypothetical protein D910_11066 [Dendroctonus ponderosae]
MANLSQSNGLLQRQPSGGVTNYGSHMETALPPRPSAAPRQMPPDPPTRPPAPQVYPQTGGCPAGTSRRLHAWYY